MKDKPKAFIKLPANLQEGKSITVSKGNKLLSNSWKILEYQYVHQHFAAQKIASLLLSVEIVWNVRHAAV